MLASISLTCPGFDLTLRPPKANSILLGFGETWSQVIAKAHRESVDQVIDTIAKRSVFRATPTIK